MTQEELKKYESIPNRRYYVLMEDDPCWIWSRNNDNTFDWDIIGYNPKVVSPRIEISEDDIQRESDDYAIEFAEWCDDNYFKNGKGNSNWSASMDWDDNEKFTTKELLEIFKKQL